MKTVFVILAIALLSVGLASAQVSKPFSVYAGGGLSILQPEYDAYYKNGFHGMGAAGFNMMPMLQLLGKAEFHSFSAEDLGADSLSLSSSMTSMMFGGALKLAPSVPAMTIKPFAIAGAGIAAVKIDATLDFGDFGTASGSETITKFYYEFGAGLEFAASPNLNLFVMARYVTLSTEFEKTKYIPITVGLKF